jgi:uncharacterized membrane protein (UPF0127 family)
MKVFYKEEEILNNVKAADTFSLRTMGLMFRESMGEMDGLVLEPCNSIHTFFMKFSIDVVFLNSKNKVIKIFRELPPWRITRMYFSASKVLEMEAGKLSSDLTEGETLDFRDV